MTTARRWPIITMKSEPRTRLAPHGFNKRCGKATKVCCHLVGVAADFLSCCVFAFLEVSRTMIVTVYFPIWKVRRIRITPFREGWTHPPCRECHSRACLRDGPPMARLRKMRGTFLCHWQRCPAFPPACLYERPSLSPVGDLYFTGIPVFRQGLCCIFNAASVIGLIPSCRRLTKLARVV